MSSYAWDMYEKRDADVGNAMEKIGRLTAERDHYREEMWGAIEDLRDEQVAPAIFRLKDALAAHGGRR